MRETLPLELKSTAPRLPSAVEAGEEEPSATPQ